MLLDRLWKLILHLLRTDVAKAVVGAATAVLLSVSDTTTAS